MKLRQRYKKLKQEFELLKRQAVVPKLVIPERTGRIVQLRAKQVYNPVEWEYIPEEYNKREVARRLLEELLPYVKYEIYVDSVTGNIVMEASLDVVIQKD